METQTSQLNGSGEPKYKGQRKAKDGHVTGQYKDRRWKRSADSIRRQVATAARNRRAALRDGKPYGHTPGKVGKRAAIKAPRKPAARRSAGGAIDALTYLGHARTRLLRAVTEGSPGADTVLGLVALAIESLGGDTPRRRT